MSKYRKKPVIIDAFVWTGDQTQVEDPKWITKAIKEGIVYFDGGEMIINTLEGEMVAHPNDYIIQGVKGEIYPCKPDIFEMTYEVVNDG